MVSLHDRCTVDAQQKIMIIRRQQTN